MKNPSKKSPEAVKLLCSRVAAVFNNHSERVKDWENAFYLLQCIINDTCLMLSPHVLEKDEQFLHFMEQFFPHDHPVWEYIDAS